MIEETLKQIKSNHKQITKVKKDIIKLFKQLHNLIKQQSYLLDTVRLKLKKNYLQKLSEDLSIKPQEVKANHSIYKFISNQDSLDSESMRRLQLVKTVRRLGR